MKIISRFRCIVGGGILLAMTVVHAEEGDISLQLTEAYDRRDYQHIYNVAYSLHKMSSEEQERALSWFDEAAVKTGNLLMLDLASKLVHDLHNGKLTCEYHGYFSGEDGAARFKVLFGKLKQLYARLPQLTLSPGMIAEEQAQRVHRIAMLQELEGKMWYRFPDGTADDRYEEQQCRVQYDVDEIISSDDDMRLEDFDSFCLDVVQSQWFACIKDAVWGTHHIYYDRKSGIRSHDQPRSDVSVNEALSQLKQLVSDAFGSPDGEYGDALQDLFGSVPHSPSYKDVAALGESGKALRITRDPSYLRIKLPSENSSKVGTPRSGRLAPRGKKITNGDLLRLVPPQEDVMDIEDIDQEFPSLEKSRMLAASSSGQKKNGGRGASAGTKGEKRKQGRYGKKYRPVKIKRKRA